MKRGIIILVFSVFLLSTLFLYQTIKFNDKKLHVVFCNVGQGDGIFVRTSNGLTILIDGGPDDSILTCLSNHMPFWDRTISIMILTHPHADHLNGLISVLKSYSVGSFYTEKLKNKTGGFAQLQNELANQKIRQRFVLLGNGLKLPDGVHIGFVGPTEEFLDSSSPNGTIGESAEFGSVLTNLTYGSFSALLTGDSQAQELTESLGSVETPLAVLQVPHHGSKTGMDEEILSGLNPKLSVISVGSWNRYGHPSKEALDLPNSVQTHVFRTDKMVR